MLLCSDSDAIGSLISRWNHCDNKGRREDGFCQIFSGGLCYVTPTITSFGGKSSIESKPLNFRYIHYPFRSAVRQERRCASSGSVPAPFSLYPTRLRSYPRRRRWLRCSSGRSDLARARFPRRQATAVARPWPRTWLTETIKMAGGMLDDGTRHNKSGAHGRRGAISV